MWACAHLLYHVHWVKGKALTLNSKHKCNSAHTQHRYVTHLLSFIRILDGREYKYKSRRRTGTKLLKLMGYFQTLGRVCRDRSWPHAQTCMPHQSIMNILVYIAFEKKRRREYIFIYFSIFSAENVNRIIN